MEPNDIFSTYLSLNTKHQMIVTSVIQGLDEKSYSKAENNRLFSIMKTRRKHIGGYTVLLNKLNDSMDYGVDQKTYDAFFQRKSKRSSLFKPTLELLSISDKEIDLIKNDDLLHKIAKADIWKLFNGLSKKEKKVVSDLIYLLYEYEKNPEDEE